MTRAERVEVVQALYDEGATGTEIAELLDLSNSYVYELLNDPSGQRTRERKDSYRGTCTRCGAPTDGSNGRQKAPKNCERCELERRHEEKLWTREAVVEAIRLFAAKYGRPPLATEWNTSASRAAGRFDWLERFYSDGCWPHVSTVQGNRHAVFKTWNEAIEAAGFTPREIGKYERLPGNRYGKPVFWTEERIIAAIRRDAVGGRPPSSDTWRTANGHHPNRVTVVRRFGSWADAVRAAGFEPRRQTRAAA